MATVGSENYRMQINRDYNAFVRDELTLMIIRSVGGKTQPVILRLEYITDNLDETQQVPTSNLPTELCELLLTALARELLSAESDLVKENHKLRNQLERVTKQLDNLIAGIGMLGGQA